MAVSVNQVQRREEKDPLDTIIKGLSIAQGIYGIKDAGAKAEQLKAQTELQKQQAETQAALAQKQMDQMSRQEKGIVTAGELLNKAGSYQASTAEDKEAIPFQVQREGKVETVYLKPPKQEKQADVFADELKRMRLEEMRRKEADAAFAKTPEGRLKGLNSGDKQRLDNAKLGLTAVQGMADALLRQNQNTFSVVGDNDFTQQRTLFEEALGRMQSGGAISKEEESRFKSMAPTFRDSEPLQRKKLLQLQAEMQSRLSTLGFRPDDLGVQVVDINTLKKPGGIDPSVMNTAVASEGDDGGLTLQEKAQRLLIKKQGIKAKLPGK